MRYDLLTAGHQYNPTDPLLRKMNDVLESTRTYFKEELNKAYRAAQRDLNNRVVGEKVSLMYPFEEGKQEGPRVGEVQGTVRSIEVGEIPYRNKKFTTFVTFEDGREFTDPEAIEIIDESNETIQ